jgi:CBS domain-containing protein
MDVRVVPPTMLRDMNRADALTAAPDTPVADVTAAMRAHGRAVVAVVDEQRPVGVVTLETVGRAVVADEDVRTLPVASLVDDDPVTIRETADREALLRLLARRGVRTAVLVDESDAYAGVVAFEDLLATYAREFDALLELVE